MEEQTSELRIFLIRHARPLVPDQGWFSASTARTYINDYDAAAVEAFVLQHESIPYQHITKVYCSSLIRSQLTAKAIFGEQVTLVASPEFREFERKIAPLPWLRLPIKFWLVLARVLWFLGFNKRGIESFKQARQRARRCALLLAQDAQTNQNTILVAHGLLNHFIRRELLKLGWTDNLKEGHGFVAVNVVAKKA